MFGDEEMEEPVFEAARMERLVKQDRLLRFVVDDLVKRGHPRHRALEVTFNGYVLEDSVMIRAYNRQ